MSSNVNFSKMTSAEMKQHFADMVAQKEMAEKREAEEHKRKEKEKERQEEEHKEKERKEKACKDKECQEKEERIRNAKRKREAAEKAAAKEKLEEYESDTASGYSPETTPASQGKGKQKAPVSAENLVAEWKHHADEFQRARAEKAGHLKELKELEPAVATVVTGKRKTREEEEEDIESNGAPSALVVSGTNACVLKELSGRPGEYPLE